MSGKTKYLAMSLATALVLFAANLNAQTEEPPAQPVGNTAVAPDHDGDGIPNGQDTDFVRGTARGRGQVANFIDENGDGICDLFQGGRKGNRGGRGAAAMNKTAAQGANFVDADGDGVCDYNRSGAGMRNGQGQGPNFIDANGDGICDNFQNAAGAQNQQLRRGKGRMGGRR